MENDSSQKTRRDFMKGSGAAAGAAALAGAFGGGRKVHAHEINALRPTPEQIQGFLAIEHDGPIVMVNLLKFKPDGGEAEYAKYAAAIRPILKKIGARILFSSNTEFCLLGDADWDAIALVEYPNKMSLIRMSASPEYQAIHHHRENGLKGQVNYAVVQTEDVAEE